MMSSQDDDEEGGTIIGMPIRERDPFVGRSIGHFRLIRKLAEGGMGTVYLAKHTGGGRSAAVKLLLPEFAHSQDVVRRFFNEAKAAMSIQHPGIVEVYAFGYDSDSNAYIVMEYLDGETLEARVTREGILPTANAVVIGRMIAECLAAAHAAGIVHRDLKPDNIVLIQAPQVAGGVLVKLLDFGVAKLVSAAPMTQIGDLMGTPLYMAPEQCRGAVNVDHRSDLYALGCLLYRMVCGRPPFDGDNISQVLLAQVHGTVKPPRELSRDIPKSLEALILGLLEKDPDDRPDSGAEVTAALREIEATLPPPVMPARVNYDSAPFPTQPASGLPGVGPASGPQPAQNPSAPYQAQNPSAPYQAQNPSAPYQAQNPSAPYQADPRISAQQLAQQPSGQYSNQRPSAPYPVPHNSAPYPAQRQSAPYPAPRPSGHHGAQPTPTPRPRMGSPAGGNVPAALARKSGRGPAARPQQFQFDDRTEHVEHYNASQATTWRFWVVVAVVGFVVTGAITWLAASLL